MSLRMALVTQFSPWYLPRAPPKWFSPLDKIISLYFFGFFNFFLFFFVSQGACLPGFHQVTIFFVFLNFFYFFCIFALGYSRKLCVEPVKVHAVDRILQRFTFCS